jgi:hypothetical protein
VESEGASEAECHTSVAWRAVERPQEAFFCVKGTILSFYFHFQCFLMLYDIFWNV